MLAMPACEAQLPPVLSSTFAVWHTNQWPPPMMEEPATLPAREAEPLPALSDAASAPSFAEITH